MQFDGPVGAEVEVFNAMGQAVFSQKSTVAKFDITWDLSGVSAGLYAVRVLTDNGIFTKKLVVKR